MSALLPRADMCGAMVHFGSQRNHEQVLSLIGALDMSRLLLCIQSNISKHALSDCYSLARTPPSGINLDSYCC
jgi:hypothetical protein